MDDVQCFDERALAAGIKKQGSRAADAKTRVGSERRIKQDFGVRDSSQARVRRRKRRHCPDYRELGRKLVERGSSETKDCPIVHGTRAQTLIEVYRRRVPIEHGPLKPSATTRHSQACKMFEQCFTDSAAASLRLNKQIFEINAGTP